MMLVVDVDYIAFEGNGDLIFKEVGVVSVGGRRTAHLLVKMSNHITPGQH